MKNNPLTQACLHLATPEEQQRDPGYLACNAQPGQPCTWARRYDGLPNPAFHSQRIEAAVSPDATAPATDTQAATAFRDAVLATGLV